MKEVKFSKTLIVLMILCVCLSLATLAIVVYDRFIKKEPEHAILKPLEVPITEDTVSEDENENGDSQEVNETESTIIEQE